jgi:hypothetical protein
VYLPRPAIAVTVLLAAVAGCSVFSPNEPSSPGSASSGTVPAEMLNPAVTPQTIDQTICVEGYAKRTRASDATLNAIKRRLIEEGGQTDGALYDLTPRVPVELGGDPQSVNNFVLQPWDMQASARPKQRLVAPLQRLVCARQVPLREAQEAMPLDWRAAYGRYVKE